MYLGTSVQPPTKTPDFENFTLWLSHVFFRGGLTPRLNFVKLVISESFLKSWCNSLWKNTWCKQTELIKNIVCWFKWFIDYRLANLQGLFYHVLFWLNFDFAGCLCIWTHIWDEIRGVLEEISTQNHCLWFLGFETCISVFTVICYDVGKIMTALKCAILGVISILSGLFLQYSALPRQFLSFWTNYSFDWTSIFSYVSRISSIILRMFNSELPPTSWSYFQVVFCWHWCLHWSQNFLLRVWTKCWKHSFYEHHQCCNNCQNKNLVLWSPESEN